MKGKVKHMNKYSTMKGTTCKVLVQFKKHGKVYIYNFKDSHVFESITYACDKVTYLQLHDKAYEIVLINNGQLWRTWRLNKKGTKYIKKYYMERR